MLTLVTIFLSFSILACDSLYVNISTGTWASEISWTISDSGGTLLFEETVFEDFTGYSTGICLDPGCYTIDLFDSYGDGWQGGVMEVVDPLGNEIVSGTIPDGFYASFAFGLANTCGCTDSQALNYESTAVEDDGSCVTCSAIPIVVEMSTGTWGSEVSWEILGQLGTPLASGTGYEDFTTYTSFVCVSPGCMTLMMYDSYGDGWQGGEIFIYDLSENLIGQGFVPPGEFEASFTFTAGGFCAIEGCTDPDASNYSPSANIDDGSCIPLYWNVSLIGQWNDNTLPNNGFGGAYSDVYGGVINGIEYAVIASTEGAHILSLEDPTNPTESAFIPGAFGGSGVTHRDYHIIGNLLYAASDQGASTLQVIDLSPLPSPPVIIYNSDAIFSRAHNIFIDVMHDRLYAVSASGTGLSSPVLVIDISIPTAPVLEFDLSNFISGAHDIYVEDDVAFINGAGGLTVVDLSGATPTLAGTLYDYPDQGGNHSGWRDKNTGIYVFADENHGYDLKVCDTNDLTDITVESTFNSDVDPSSIPHNLIIKDQYVHLSYYHDGLQIFDLSDPQNPVLAGYYDTFLPNDHSGFKGAWGVYPLLPSGLILISDMMEGLFVLDFLLDNECIGDFNNDLYVNAADLLLFLTEFGCVADCLYDLDNDSQVNSADLLIFLTGFGTMCP
jgi:choice-of-anchor B domain-containing protein